MIWPLLIGAGVNLIGGLIQQGAQNKAQADWDRRADAAAAEPQIIRNTVDFEQMVKDAEAAGFNPLTVLQSGGMGAYNVQQHPNLHPLPNVQHGVSHIGNAMQNVGGMISNYDYGASQRQALEWQLMDAQIKNLNADTKMRMGGAPSANVGSGSYQGGGALSLDHLGMPTSEHWETMLPSVTNPFHEIWHLESNPYFSDVETGAQARYGDFGGIPFSVLTYGADAAWNIYRFGNYVHDVVGPQFREMLQSWVPSSGSPSGKAAPLQITVGGPNQTGL